MMLEMSSYGLFSYCCLHVKYSCLRKTAGSSYPLMSWKRKRAHTNNTRALYHTDCTPHCSIRPRVHTHSHTHAHFLTCRLPCMGGTHFLSHAHTYCHTITFYVAFSILNIYVLFHSSMPVHTMQELLSDVNYLNF